MNNFEFVAESIVAFIKAPQELLGRLIRSSRSARFIACGPSGSGMPRAIDRANENLPQDQQIAESYDLLGVQNCSAAMAILEDPALKYVGAEHVELNLVQKELAKKLELNGIKVFWLR